jgi:hypothetical protein
MPRSVPSLPTRRRDKFSPAPAQSAPAVFSLPFRNFATEPLARFEGRYLGSKVRSRRRTWVAEFREYLSCERGELELVASGAAFRMAPGDVVVFRGDQRHSYVNVGSGAAVGYSVVMLRPIE